MTGKVPVERTISDAYRFVFARFLSILGTIWLPYLILAAIVFALVRLMAPDLPRMIASGDFDVAAGMELLRLAVMMGIFGFIIGAMVTVDLQHKVMGTHTGPSYVFFSLGAPVWRMAGALFLAGVVVFVVVLIAILVCAAVWWAASSLGAAGALIRVAAVLAALALVIYIVLRLMFFLPAVVAAENSIGIERAWILGGHNFWRILIVAIAVVLPIVILFHLLSWALVGPLLSWNGMHSQMGVRELMRAALMQYGPKGYVILFFQLLERILLAGLINGAVASAYLAVNGHSGDPVAAVRAP
jgi:hypothetical protein